MDDRLKSALSGVLRKGKNKLLDNQKKGKKKMMAMGRGRVDIPPDTFIKILKR